MLVLNSSLSKLLDVHSISLRSQFSATLISNRSFATFFRLFHFDVELVVRQRDKNYAISRN